MGWLFKLNNMNLYTEQQVIQLLYWISPTYIGREEVEERIKKELTPIELPSDDEVGKIVLGNSPIMEHRDSGYFAAGAMKYNKWMKEQILNQNK